jgi:predicted NAD/FAD-dependent oxidoreductase
LELLNTGGVEVAPIPLSVLKRITYEPCIAVLYILDGPSDIPEPGGMWTVSEPITWIADSHTKGISAAPGAVTVHAGPEFSEEYWNADDAEIVILLSEVTRPWLGSLPVETEVIRWPFSKPVMTYPDPCLVIEEGSPLILAGDAFAGPRVEGAYLSGLAAAEALL